MFIRPRNQGGIITKTHGEIYPDTIMSLWLYFRIFSNILDKDDSIFDCFNKEWHDVFEKLAKINEYDIDEQALWQIAELMELDSLTIEEKAEQIKVLIGTLYLTPIETEYNFEIDTGIYKPDTTLEKLISEHSKLQAQLDYINSRIENVSISNILLASNSAKEVKQTLGEEYFNIEKLSQFINGDKLSSKSKQETVDIIVNFLSFKYIKLTSDNQYKFINRVPPQVILNILKFLFYFELSSKEPFNSPSAGIATRTRFYEIFKSVYNDQTYLKVQRKYSKIIHPYDGKGYGLYDKKYCPKYFEQFKMTLLESGNNSFSHRS